MRRTKEQWAEIIGRQKSSGLNVKAFAAREGLTEGALYSAMSVFRRGKNSGRKVRSRLTPKNPKGFQSFAPLNEHRMEATLNGDGKLHLSFGLEALPEVLRQFDRRAGDK